MGMRTVGVLDEASQERWKAFIEGGEVNVWLDAEIPLGYMKDGMAWTLTIPSGTEAKLFCNIVAKDSYTSPKPLNNAPYTVGTFYLADGTFVSVMSDHRLCMSGSTRDLIAVSAKEHAEGLVESVTRRLGLS